MIVNWDEVEGERLEEGHLAGTWTDLGEAAGSIRIGVTRIQVESGRWSTPAHVELDEEEIFFVLAGAGLSWQDGKTHEVGPGDCLVHRVGHEVHTLRAGDDGIDVLAFGERTNPTLTYLPRAKVARSGVTLDASEGPHPWKREASAGAPEVGEPEPRPETVVNLADIEGEYGGIWKPLARTAGAVRTGLNWLSLPPGTDGAPPHCHSADEELFVVLNGSGALELWPAVGTGGEPEQQPIRAGHVISRLAATRVAHRFIAGDEGMTFLVYGTREPNDICYYPRSNKIFFRGVGVIGRLEQLEYMDGEPED